MKKLFVLISVIAVTIIACVSFNASADDGTVIIDNVVYELTTQKYGSLDYGTHYVVTDFFEDETLSEKTTEINIVNAIDGIEVKAIKTNDMNEDDIPFYSNKYSCVKNVYLPNTLKYISPYSLNCFPSVENIYLPTELEALGVGAFSGMKSLKSIIIPSGISAIGKETFRNCKSLEKVIINGDITYIGYAAFSGCENLTTINLPYSLKRIDEFAFSDTAIKKIIIPESTDISEVGIFNNCLNLEKIVFEDTGAEKRDYIVFDEMFLKCEAVKGIYMKTIPLKAISIGEFALSQMPSLQKIYFAGSQEKWNDLVAEKDNELLESKGIEVEFYYRHSHSFKQSGKATCKNGGTYTYTCECGDSYKHSVTKDQVKHNYGAWKTTKKATYTATGTKQRICSVCSKTEKQTIKQLKLGEVENILIKGSLNKITLSWDAVKDATGYRVYLYEKGTNKCSKIASVKGKTTYTVKNLEENTIYRFAIQPYYKDSKGNVVFGEKTDISAMTLTSKS